ncbi:MAG TPA: hypothetical protein VGB04_11380 [Allosphingosinicella sp.]|jgi:hypothetical protein
MKILVAAACSSILLALTFAHGSSAGAANDWLGEAIAHQDAVLADRLLEEVVRDSDRRRRLSNPASGGVPVLARRCGDFPAPTRPEAGLDWLFEQFRTRGGQKREDIGFYTPFWPWSDAVAVTAAPCAIGFEFNKLREHHPVGATHTLIHERIHTFGHKHARGNKRPPNACDAAYVTADAAEAITAHRSNLASYEFGAPMCRALCEALAERQMAHGCTAKEPGKP